MPSTAVGLDIGRTAVRAVELRRGRTGTGTVRRHAAVPLARGAVEAGVVADPGEVTAALRRLWREGRFSTRAVRLGVSSGSVLVRQVELDWMPPADLRRALRYQVADLLPVAVDDANLDHVHLGEHERTDPATGQVRRMVRILLVATARGAVDEMVRAVRAAGLRPLTADLVPLALVRAAAAAPYDAASAGGQHTPGAAEAVIDVGSDKVAVAVHTAGVPHFVRVVPGVGGDLLTQALVDSAGLAWEHAEEVKRSGRADRDPALLAATARLVEEVRATLEFHSATDPAHVATRVRTTGATGAHPAFLEHCGRVLGVPVAPLEAGTVVGLPSSGRRRGGGRGDRGDARPARPASPDLLVPASLCLGEIA